MIILADKGQKAGKHENKHTWMRNNGIEVVMAPLPVGDYILGTEKVLDVIKRRGDKLKKMDFMGAYSISVDTKASLTELYGNLVQDHKRFHDEVVLAQQCGIKLYILVENEFGFQLPQDIIKWKNPQMFKWYRTVRKLCNMTEKWRSWDEVIMHAKMHNIKLPKQPCTNQHLIKVMASMTRDYGVEFLFCSSKESGAQTIQLLEQAGD